jgi:phosphatidylglycerol:prolipoprotein diacylglycerol transferase
MRPILFEFHLPLLGQVIFPSYFSLLTIGFALAMLLSWRDAKQQGISPDAILDLNICMFFFGLVGARLLHVFADGHLLDYVHACIAPETIKAVGNMPAHCVTDAECAPYFLCNSHANHCYPPRDCLLALKFWRGGLTFYGGFIMATLYGLHYIRKHKHPLWKVTDLAGYGIPLGLVFGRLGCYLNGCCFGRMTNLPLGVTFPRGGAVWQHQRALQLITETAHSLPVHPTQLYSAGTNAVLFLVLYFWMRPHKRFDGQVFWLFVLLYGLTRMAIECLREDDRGIWGGILSTSQMISIPMIGIAAFMLWRLMPHETASTDAHP